METVLRVVVALVLVVSRYWRVRATRSRATLLTRHPTPMPSCPWNLPVTARSLQGMAPYPGQARCLALGFWPECFRRLDVKGGRRKFPEETRSALDIEGKHVTIQGPSLDLIPAIPIAPSAGCRDLLIRRFLCGRPAPHAATS